MLFGEYNYTIDEKGRLNFPARFREDMGDNFIIARWLDDCVVAFPEKEMQRMFERLDEKSMVKSSDVRRTLFSSACVVEPDKQGRILVPAKLRAHAQLEKEATIIGVGSYAEIWNTQQWQERSETMTAQTFASALEQLAL